MTYVTEASCTSYETKGGHGQQDILASVMRSFAVMWEVDLLTTNPLAICKMDKRGPTVYSQ